MFVKKAFIFILILIVPSFIIINNHLFPNLQVLDWMVGLELVLFYYCIQFLFYQEWEASCLLNKTDVELELHFNDLENKSEIRVIANTDSFISVITTNEDGRVGNVLCAYSSLMVKIISTKIQPHDFIAVFQP